MAFDDEVRQLTTEACALVEGRLRVLTSQPGLINRHVSAGFLARCLALLHGTVALADAGLDDVCAVLSRALLESCLLGLYVLLGGREAITELMGDYQRNVQILADRRAQRLTAGLAPPVDIVRTTELVKTWAEGPTIDTRRATDATRSIEYRASYIPPHDDLHFGCWTSMGSR